MRGNLTEKTMNFSAVILFSLICSCSAVFDYRERCLLYRNTCVNHCPRMMHPYHTRCDGETMSQRTCHSPHVYVLGFTCGWSRCDCNGEHVLDESTWLCVPLEECPIPLPLKHSLRRRPGDGAKLSKNLRIRDKDLIQRIMDGDD